MDKSYIIDPNKEYNSRQSIAFQGEYTYIINDKEERNRQVNRARSCFEQYLIQENTLENVEVDGKIVGFKIGLRLNWYRSFALTLIRRIELMIDGKLIPRESITFQVEGSENKYRLDDIGEDQAFEYWYLNKIGYVTVDLPGGLSKGVHEVEALLEMFVTYHNYPDVSYLKKIMRIE